MSTPLLEARDLTLRRGSFTLRVPSLILHERETLALLGRNGAGKSSFLHLLALLERPDHGQVLLRGAPVHPSDTSARRAIAVSLQQPLLLDTSVAANVGLGLGFHRVPRGERRARVAAWMERTGIAGLAKRRATTLSGGEQRRVSLARALALQPAVLFLDEPFAAIDQPTHESLLAELPEWLAAAGCATVLVTHSRDDAARLAGSIAVLVDGELRQHGPAQTVLTRPVDPQVAAVVGVENLFPARVTSSADGLLVLYAGELEFIAAGNLPAGSTVMVAVHPEQVLLLAPNTAPRGRGRNHLPARVRDVRAGSPGLRVRVDLGGVELLIALTRATAAELDLSPGAAVIVTIRPADLHLMRRGER